MKEKRINEKTNFNNKTNNSFKPIMKKLGPNVPGFVK